ncbi:polyhydroxyalkanoate depolymerase [Amaricoccus sp.]|uniref:polyhydroxyalkanoate depolymerase n=1 Tax=Amaricoccus sp. TaxID=1872485 RepID=UPI00261AA4E0|nr:polyhydroxyalkanoate depolymerase [Amaricoccus sp.]HRO11443.1 polyhydroxyalkanoate depolymerase [Amaricoccus sp.]
MLYHAYEMTHVAFSPMRAAARVGREVMRNPLNPMASTYSSRALSAALEMFINATRRYAKPMFGIEEVEVDGVATPISEQVVWSAPFCNLLHFQRGSTAALRRNDPKVLVIAPMSGHFATLLRGTVRDLLPNHEVYITDWTDARDVSLAFGEFDLDDYTDYLIAMIEHLSQDGERIAVMAVCQPGIPAMVASALMSMQGNSRRPASLVLMGSPMDVARNPKQPNELAQQRSLAWFENNVVVLVPWPKPGYSRRVYPGFLQLTGFLSMNLNRHVDAHVEQFRKLVQGDGDGAEQHRAFYDEYLAVMDLTADFYLQTIDRVFQRRLLANGAYRYRGMPIDTAAVGDIALMTIEGEKDDITGLGQTEAAHDMVPNLPDHRRVRFVAEGVGHYGVFNGSRWRTAIEPQVREFIRTNRQSH